MEQYDLTNAELSEQDLTHVSGGGWISSIIRGAGSIARGARDGAAVYGATSIAGSFIPHSVSVSGSSSTSGTINIVPPKIDNNGYVY